MRTVPTAPRRGMRSRVRDLGIRTRLGLAFGGIGLLVVGCAAGGVSAVGQQRGLAQQVVAVDGVLRNAETMRYQIADVTGWQGYVLASATYGPQVALAESRSVQEAAGGSTEIATNITGVSTAASSTTQALGQTRQAVDELSRMADDLRRSVASFTV